MGTAWAQYINTSAIYAPTASLPATSHWPLWPTCSHFDIPSSYWSNLFSKFWNQPHLLSHNFWGGIWTLIVFVIIVPLPPPTGWLSTSSGCHHACLNATRVCCAAVQVPSPHINCFLFIAHCFFDIQPHLQPMQVDCFSQFFAQRCHTQHHRLPCTSGCNGWWQPVPPFLSTVFPFWMSPQYGCFIELL